MIKEYENYQDTSKSYDKTRIPIGIEILLDGSIVRYLEQRESLRQNFGQTTFVYAYKK